MKIERKTLSLNEVILYFSESLPIVGSFFNKDAYLPTFFTSTTQIIPIEEVLLTTDFLYIKSSSADMLEDAETLFLAELDDHFSNSTSTCLAPLEHIDEKIELILKLIVAPFLQKDGGDIKFISLKDGIVSVRFLGKCNGCPYANRTLKERVEKNLIRYLPQIKEVVLV